ncbi:hypothetical protein GGR52DRAFT_446681 [Hypoxylon sp. FL1284]|nr:hypothetical protein GGR52DRAFT_446681 [Hypoxylon sp. FL1284]
MASPPKVSWLSLSDCQTTVTLNDQRFGSERAADESEPSRSFLVQGDMNGATQHVKTTRPFSFETPNGPSKFMLEEQLSLRSSRKTQVSPSPPSLRSRFYTTPPTSILTKASYSPVPDDKLPSLSSSESQSSAQEIDESPVIPSSDLIPDGSLPPLPLQLPPTPFENALNCPMIPVSPLQGPLYDPVMHNPEYSLYGTPSVRFASTSHPRYLDGLIPVTNSEHTSLSGTAGRLSSWERLLFER